MKIALGVSGGIAAYKAAEILRLPLAGFDGVLLTRERSAPLGGIAAKAAAGALSHIAISQVTNLSESLKQLKEAGAWIFGAVKDASAQSLYETDLLLPACIVVGSEGQGIRPLVRRQCDVLVSIPMPGALDSLNSSVAAGIIMFESLRQMLAAGVDERTAPEDVFPSRTARVPCPFPAGIAEPSSAAQPARSSRQAAYSQMAPPSAMTGTASR